jgi:tRNA modification GTPase
LTVFNRMKDLSDTICALATARGRAGIAAVRISGRDSQSLLKAHFLPKYKQGEFLPRRATLGKIRDVRSGLEIGEAIAIVFPKPKSYTGEDLVEISIHGNPALIAALLDSLCAGGARLAEPGEFTMRAFLNGRMDLTQAEAVRDIIDAMTLHQARVASRQHSGEIGKGMQKAKQNLIGVIAKLESAVEFEEEDLQAPGREQDLKEIYQVLEDLRKWIESYRVGRIVRDGFSLAIAGLPNAGKSSLFNALLKQDRSIVTETPGTTRDIIAEFTSLGGIPVRLLDTAGIHKSDDKVENLGICRSLNAIQDADAIILVIDTSRPCSIEDWEMKKQLEGIQWLAVMNKSDLSIQWTDIEKKEYAGTRTYIEASAKTGYGIEELRSEILKDLLGDNRAAQEGLMITNLRHCLCLEAAEISLSKAADALAGGLSEEYALMDLHKGLKQLGEITGETCVEDLLTEIFTKFCIGK